MKTLTAKSRLNADSFFYDSIVRIGRNTVTKGAVDGKTVYYLEARNGFGEMESSSTFTSIAALKKEA